MNGPHWIKQWIADLALLNEQFRDDDGKIDFEALGREEVAFRTALMTHDFRKSKRALETFEKAKAAYDACVENGKMGGRPRKDKDNTAGAATREGAVNPEGVRIAPKAESGTPAKFSTAYAGKNGLVRLTDDEYALLLQELGNKRKADKLIDGLDYKLAEGATFRQPHLHVLTHWQSYREDKAAEAAEMAKVSAEAKAEAFSKVDRRTPYQKNQDDLLQLYKATSEKLKELK